MFERISNKGRFSEYDAVKTVKEILEGVNYLHERGIVHRDLKPENLIVSSFSTYELKSSLISSIVP